MESAKPNSVPLPAVEHTDTSPLSSPTFMEDINDFKEKLNSAEVDETLLTDASSRMAFILPVLSPISEEGSISSETYSVDRSDATYLVTSNTTSPTYSETSGVSPRFKEYTHCVESSPKLRQFIPDSEPSPVFSPSCKQFTPHSDSSAKYSGNTEASPIFSPLFLLHMEDNYKYLEEPVQYSNSEEVSDESATNSPTRSERNSINIKSDRTFTILGNSTENSPAESLKCKSPSACGMDTPTILSPLNVTPLEEESSDGEDKCDRSNVLRASSNLHLLTKRDSHCSRSSSDVDSKSVEKPSIPFFLPVKGSNVYFNSDQFASSPSVSSPRSLLSPDPDTVFEGLESCSVSSSKSNESFNTEIHIPLKAVHNKLCLNSSENKLLFSDIKNDSPKITRSNPLLPYRRANPYPRNHKMTQSESRISTKSVKDKPLLNSNESKVSTKIEENNLQSEHKDSKASTESRLTLIAPASSTYFDQVTSSRIPCPHTGCKQFLPKRIGRLTAHFANYHRLIPSRCIYRQREECLKLNIPAQLFSSICCYTLKVEFSNKLPTLTLWLMVTRCTQLINYKTVCLVLIWVLTDQIVQPINIRLTYENEHVECYATTLEDIPDSTNCLNLSRKAVKKFNQSLGGNILIQIL